MNEYGSVHVGPSTYIYITLLILYSSIVKARFIMNTQVNCSQESALEEVQKRVRAAVARKEEVVEQLRAQAAAAAKRADHLEALLEQQRALLAGKK